MEFNLEEFKKEYSYGDLSGLEYLEKTIIKNLKEVNKNATDLTREDYLIALFYATLNLNSCNNIYETTNVKNNFQYDLYFDTKYLLFKELGLELGLEEEK